MGIQAAEALQNPDTHSAVGKTTMAVFLGRISILGYSGWGWLF